MFVQTKGKCSNCNQILTEILLDTVAEQSPLQACFPPFSGTEYCLYSTGIKQTGQSTRMHSRDIQSQALIPCPSPEVWLDVLSICEQGSGWDGDHIHMAVQMYPSVR